MRVCMISKFPPIEGGIAARTYWLARGYAEAGHEVHVVTNAGCVEPEYRIDGCQQHLADLKNIYIHDLQADVPWHIPQSQAYTDRLLNSALNVIVKHNVDILDAGFLMPYGIVAFMAGKVTEVPYVLRHGGSDVAKFLQHPEFDYLLRQVIVNASMIVTDFENVKRFDSINMHTQIGDPYVPDERVFEREKRAGRAVPVIAYIGKVNHYWRNRRLDEVVIALRKKFDKCQIVFVAQGKGLEDFKRTLGGLADDIQFRAFVPPWEMPELLASVDYIVACEDTISSPSNIVAEALVAGKEIIRLQDITKTLAPTKPLDSPRSDYDFWINDNIGGLMTHCR